MDTFEVEDLDELRKALMLDFIMRNGKRREQFFNEYRKVIRGIERGEIDEHDFVFDIMIKVYKQKPKI